MNDKLSAKVSTYSTPALNSLIRQTYLLGIQYIDEMIAPSKRLFQVMYEGDGGVSWLSTSFQITEVSKELGAFTTPEGTSVRFNSFATGFFKQVRQKTIAIGKQFTMQEYKNLQVRGLMELVNTQMEDLTVKMNWDTANFLTYITQPNYQDNGGEIIDLTGGDGQPIAGTHTPKYSSTVITNLYAGAPSLSVASYEVARNYFIYNVLDNLGRPMGSRPNVLITSFNERMRGRAIQILESFGALATYDANGLNVANSNAGIRNQYMNSIEHMQIAFDIDPTGFFDVTKSYQWGLAEIGKGRMNSLGWFMGIWDSPSVLPLELNIGNLTYRTVGYAIYALMNLNSYRIFWSAATS